MESNVYFIDNFRKKDPEDISNNRPQISDETKNIETVNIYSPDYKPRTVSPERQRVFDEFSNCGVVNPDLATKNSGRLLRLVEDPTPPDQAA